MICVCVYLDVRSCDWLKRACLSLRPMGGRSRKATATGRSSDELRLQVMLPSGRGVEVSVSSTSRIGDLKIAAQKSLQQGFLKLVAPDGRVLLDPDEAITKVGLKEGDTLSAVAQAARVAVTRRAFALWCPGGGIVT